MNPLDVPLPYLSQETDRHGKPRLYVRRYGRRIRISEPPGSPAFLKAYAAALEELSGRALPPVQARQPFSAGHPGWLGAQYFASNEFRAPEADRNRTGADFRALGVAHRPEPMGFALLPTCPRKGQAAARSQERFSRRRQQSPEILLGYVRLGDRDNPPLMKTNPARRFAASNTPPRV